MVGTAAFFSFVEECHSLVMEFESERTAWNTQTFLETKASWFCYPAMKGSVRLLDPIPDYLLQLIQAVIVLTMLRSACPDSRETGTIQDTPQLGPTAEVSPA